MPPTLADRLVHILEAILGIEELLDGKTQSDVGRSRQLRMALEREFEVISEASRKIPDKIKTTQTGIGWEAMAALGKSWKTTFRP